MKMFFDYSSLLLNISWLNLRSAVVYDSKKLKFAVDWILCSSYVRIWHFVDIATQLKWLLQLSYYCFRIPLSIKSTNYWLHIQWLIIDRFHENNNMKLH